MPGEIPIPKQDINMPIPCAPPRGVEMERELLPEEITAIWKQCDESRTVADWIVNKDGKRIGWRAISIDAWCE